MLLPACQYCFGRRLELSKCFRCIVHSEHPRRSRRPLCYWYASAPLVRGMPRTKGADTYPWRPNAPTLPQHTNNTARTHQHTNSSAAHDLFNDPTKPGWPPTKNWVAPNKKAGLASTKGWAPLHRGAQPSDLYQVGIERRAHSHSMVAGGFEVTSKTTRFTSGTELVMRVEIRARTS